MIFTKTSVLRAFVPIFLAVATLPAHAASVAGGFVSADVIASTSPGTSENRSGSSNLPVAERNISAHSEFYRPADPLLGIPEFRGLADSHASSEVRAQSSGGLIRITVDASASRQVSGFTPAITRASASASASVAASYNVSPGDPIYVLWKAFKNFSPAHQDGTHSFAVSGVQGSGDLPLDLGTTLRLSQFTAAASTINIAGSMRTGSTVSESSPTNFGHRMGEITALYGIGGMPGSAISPLPLAAMPPGNPVPSLDFPVGQSSLGTTEFLYARTPVDTAGRTALELTFTTLSSITEIVVPQAVGTDTHFQIRIDQFEASPVIIPVSIGQVIQLENLEVFGVSSFTLGGIETDPGSAGPLDVDIGLKFAGPGSTPLTVTSLLVPEPSSIGLLSTAAVIALAALRRRSGW